MSIAYAKSASPTDMQDGRRRAWRTGPSSFEVISRDAETRYQVEIVGGMPICTCTAAQYRRPCWHASLVLARLEREAGGRQESEARPEPSIDELFWGL